MSAVSPEPVPDEIGHLPVRPGEEDIRRRGIWLRRRITPEESRLTAAMAVGAAVAVAGGVLYFGRMLVARERVEPLPPRPGRGDRATRERP